MKAILVIDVPDGIDLDRYRANGMVRQVIFDVGERMYSTPIEFNFCSLKPLPQMMEEAVPYQVNEEEIDAYQDPYATGFNDAIRFITGETE